MLTFIDGEPLKARLLLRGSTVNYISPHSFLSNLPVSPSLDPSVKRSLSLSGIRFGSTVEPRNNNLAFKGSPSIKVNILRSQMVVFNVILPLFKGYPEIKVKNLQSQWDR